MNEMGPALMGAGEGVGENRAVDAVDMAIASPLLQDVNISGAKGVLVNISASKESLTMAEVTEATTRIYDEVHDEANIIMGVIFDDSIGESMRVTVIATGIQCAAEVEVLPVNVKPLRSKDPADVPVGKGSDLASDSQEEAGRGAGNNGIEYADSQGRQRSNVVQKTFNRKFFDEDELDRPTFIRRNES